MSSHTVPEIFLPAQVVHGLYLGEEHHPHDVCYSDSDLEDFRKTAVAGIRRGMKDFGCFKLKISNWASYIEHVRSMQAKYFEQLTPDQKASHKMQIFANPNGYEGASETSEHFRICWNTQHGRHPLQLPKAEFFPDEVASSDEETTFAIVMRKHSANMGRIGNLLLELCAEALYLPSDFFRKNADYLDGDRLDILRLIHYFGKDRLANTSKDSSSSEGQSALTTCNKAMAADGRNMVQHRFPPHTDMGFLTMVQQFEAGGLQIENRNRCMDARGNRSSIDSEEGAWIDVPADKGAILVQGADMLEYWTQKYWMACRHRVCVAESQELEHLGLANRSRYSLVYFMHLPATTPLEVIPWVNIADSTTVRKYDKEYLLQQWQTTERFRTSREFWLNRPSQSGRKVFLLMRVLYEEFLTEEVLSTKYNDASFQPTNYARPTMNSSDSNKSSPGTMNESVAAEKPDTPIISPVMVNRERSISNQFYKESRPDYENSWVKDFASVDPKEQVSFQEVRRICRETLMELEGSDDIQERVVASINERIQVLYESQATW